MLSELTYVSDFYTLVELGGLPIAAILGLSMLIFLLFFERLYFLVFSFKRALLKLSENKTENLELGRWEQHRMQDALVAEAISSSHQYLWLLKAAIISCPLIGLMGTVSGMILVFDQISLTGTGNPRLMASGIFQATLPTMAGMMISIIGLIMQYTLHRLTLRSQAMLSLYLPFNEDKEANYA